MATVASCCQLNTNSWKPLANLLLLLVKLLIKQTKLVLSNDAAIVKSFELRDDPYLLLFLRNQLAFYYQLLINSSKFIVWKLNRFVFKRLILTSISIVVLFG